MRAYSLQNRSCTVKVHGRGQPRLFIYGRKHKSKGKILDNVIKMLILVTKNAFSACIYTDR